MPAPEHPVPALRYDDLAFDYGDGQRLAFPDLALAPGEHCLVLGPSGCGKSTLLHLIAGLLQPLSGDVWIAGQRLSALRGAALDRFRGQHLGVVFQRLHLLPALSVRDNLSLARYLAGLTRDRVRVEALLTRLGIADEPTSNLDDRNTREVLALLRQEADHNGATLLVATHDSRLRGGFQHEVQLGT